MSMTTLTIQRSPANWISRVGDYVELSKPRIASMVLVSVAVSYCVARWGQPDPLVMLNTLLGTFWIASSASSLNHWLERRQDALMQRTADRPLPAARLTVAETLVFAVITVVLGVGYLRLTVGWQPTLWGVLTWVIYVWVYTPLKTRTSLNTAVGAVAGALPVLIGWSAAGGGYGLRAAAMFLILFLWQFPHFMAIAWIYRRQYDRAGMKMLSVVDPTGRRAGTQAVFAALALLPVSVVPVLFAPGLGGSLYAIAALVLGLAQLGFAFAFCTHLNQRAARSLLRASLIYLPLLLLLLLLVPWV